MGIGITLSKEMEAEADRLFGVLESSPNLIAMGEGSGIRVTISPALSDYFLNKFGKRAEWVVNNCHAGLVGKDQKSRGRTIILAGSCGTGKSSIVDRVSKHPGIMLRRIEARKSGEQFDTFLSFGNLNAIAIDELQLWEQKSLMRGIRKLEDEAIAHGKSLILIVQHIEDIWGLGLEIRADRASYVDLRLLKGDPEQALAYFIKESVAYGT